MALLLAAMNGTTMVGMSIFTLYVYGEGSIPGLDAIGYGLLLLGRGRGSARRHRRRSVGPPGGRGPALWLTLLMAVAVPLAIGLTSAVWVVVVAQTMFGFSSVVWNVVTVSLGQAVIPDELLGRVNSVYRFLGWGAMPIGSLLGGIIAGAFGLRAPFLAASAVMACTLVVDLRTITSAGIEVARAGAARS